MIPERIIFVSRGITVYESLTTEEVGSTKLEGKALQGEDLTSTEHARQQNAKHADTRLNKTPT